MAWYLLGYYAKQQAVREAKRKGVLVYLRVLQGSRHALIGAFVMFFALQAMVFSFFGALVTGFMLWDHEFAAKVQILFWVFAVLFTLPFLVLSIALSERLWYRASGAKKMVDDLNRAA